MGRLSSAGKYAMRVYTNVIRINFHFFTLDLWPSSLAQILKRVQTPFQFDQVLLEKYGFKGKRRGGSSDRCLDDLHPVCLQVNGPGVQFIVEIFQICGQL